MTLFGSKDKHRNDQRHGPDHPTTGPGSGMGTDGPSNDSPHTGFGTDHHNENMAGTGGQSKDHQVPSFSNNQQGQYSGEGHDSSVLPPTKHLNNGTDQHRSGHALAGKIERTVGSIVGSHALKAKGYQKEQEANAFKMQGSELAEAERLEREALMRRERAVGHGAHPDNKHLGAGWNTGPPTSE